MRKTVSVPFHKLHALGNDFIVTSGLRPQSRKRVDDGWARMSLSKPSLGRLARAICDRHTGVGADGFLLVEPYRQPGYDVVVRFFNADGSEAEMSGNGLRCAGVFLLDWEDYKIPLRIKTMAGVKVLEAVKGGQGKRSFRVRMGPPVFAPRKIPFAARGISAPVIGYTLETRHGEHCVTVTSMGNPHCSVLVKNFRDIDWRSIGSEIETRRLFPSRTNVEFVRVISRREIEVRFWERGVGETASSGTGSCAAAVASILNGFTNRSVRVKTVAGLLDVEWRKGGDVFLTGPAVAIARGIFQYWPE